ncbi:MAG: hypothetical protein WD824_19975 [Cyclobacteriaceae bacterium]
MPSLIPGYEYDIFISYRHNDNKYDGWVTEFVSNLAKELEATVKGKVTIYFDQNPQDGMHENHHVDESLAPKLRALVFIPIISKTYCDLHSFAWNNELLAFVKGATCDNIGMQVKLRTGNVSNRVLPIRIHDLEDEDIQLLESTLKTKMRPIDFIFKSAGVNRPLKPADDLRTDSQHAFYRDQINKVANAISEVINAVTLQNKNKETQMPPPPTAAIPVTKSLLPKIAMAAVALLLVMAMVYGSQFVNFSKKETIVDKSIAVLPFVNMSSDPGQEYFSDGMMEEILNQLAKIRDLKVTSRTSSMLYRDSKLPVKAIAEALSVGHILEGSVRKSADKVRITVQLIDAHTDKHLWSETFDTDLKDVFSVQTEISKNIASKLKGILTPMEQKLLEQIPTTNKVAYEYYLKGKLIIHRGDGFPSLKEGVKLFTKAIESDPEFSAVYAERGGLYSLWYFNRMPSWEGKDKLAQQDIAKAEMLNNDVTEIQVKKAFILYQTQGNYNEAIRILEKVTREYPNNAGGFKALYAVQRRMGLFDQAIKNAETALALDPNNVSNLHNSAYLYYAIRKYEVADDMCNRLLALEPRHAQGIQIKFYVLVSWKGTLEEALKSVDNSDSVIQASVKYYKRDFNSLIQMVHQSPKAVHETQTVYTPRALKLAELYFFSGNKKLSKAYADSALVTLTATYKKLANDFRIHSAMAFAEAYAGNFSQAVAYAKSANMLMPIGRDSYSKGPATEIDLAKIYILTGQYDLAIRKIEYMLTKPALLNLTPAFLRIDPMYDPLRKFPAFMKILGTEYKIDLSTARH